jgi:hypothetical protein
LNSHAREIRRLIDKAEELEGRALEYYKEAGDRLIAAKERVKAQGGKWEEWLEANFKFTARTATNYMRIASEWDGALQESRKRNPNLGLREALDVLQTVPQKELPPGLEDVFAHAVALEQKGRFRSTIYCIGRKVYILNHDHTILLQFVLPEGEPTFETPLAFYANDYDSLEFRECGERIEFVQRIYDAGQLRYIRSKLCHVPKYTPGEVEQMLQSYEPPQGKPLTLLSIIRKGLNEDLSHIEFSGREGRLKIVQRNIYDGSLIAIDTVGFDDPVEDFGPFGLRTQDLLALFAFARSVAFYPSGENVVWFESQDARLNMKGVLSQCVYDELGGEFQEETEDVEGDGTTETDDAQADCSPSIAPSDQTSVMNGDGWNDGDAAANEEPMAEPPEEPGDGNEDGWNNEGWEGD